MNEELIKFWELESELENIASGLGVDFKFLRRNANNYPEHIRRSVYYILIEQVRLLKIYNNSELKKVVNNKVVDFGEYKRLSQ